jgi:peroxiredoxin Q/BCP
MSLKVKLDQKAPAFKVPDQDGVIRSLAEFAGQWLVLYFYPKDSTPGCTCEAQDFTKELKAFEKLDATIVGVSADSPASHQKFIKKYNLKITLLADEDQTMLKQYGVWQEKSLYGKKFMGIVRSTLLIDPKGVVRAIWEKVKVAEHVSDVKEKLKELNV